MTNGAKSFIVSGAAKNNRADSIALGEEDVQKLVNASNQYYGWVVYALDEDGGGVMLYKQDASTGGKQFLPLNRADVQRLYDAQKPTTMNIRR